MALPNFILLAIVITCLQISDGFAQADENTSKLLEKYRSDYTKCILNQQPEAIAAYYDEEVRLMPEFQKTVMGKSQALTYYDAFLDCFKVQGYKRKEVEILDLGSQVIELGEFNMKMVVKNSDQEQNVAGKYLTVWEKSEAGSLSLLAEAWNYNHPLENEAQFKLAEVPAVDIALQAHLPIDSPIRFELAALNRLMESAVSQHDADLWAQFYADDGMFLYSRNPIYQGKKALNDFLKVHAAESPVFEKLDVRNDRVDDLGEYIIEYASHIAIIRNGGFSGVFTGKDLRIWRREPSGSLKIFRHIGMYD